MSARDAIAERIRRGGAIARASLEGLLLSLREFPIGVDRTPIAAIVETMLAEASLLPEMDPEHDGFFPAIDRLLASAREARDRVAPLGESTAVLRAEDRLIALEKGLRALREASIDALVAMQDRRLHAARPEASAEAPPEPFRASGGVPSLHAVLRGPARVHVDLRRTTVPDEIDDAEDVLDDPELAPAARELSPDDARLAGHARAMARDCLGDIASLSGLRVPLPDAPWTHGEPFERRLLANLDALLALAAEPHGLPDAFSVFDEVQRYARESPTVDPRREFARAFAFACTSGDHALRAVALTVKQAHPDTLPGYRDALSLARHPATAGMMRELLREKDPRLLTLAIDVLRFVREARFADLVPALAHPDAGARGAAARALGFVPERQAAADVLADALGDEDDARVGLHVAEALVRLRRVEGLAWARDRVEKINLDGDRDLRLGALAILAIAGGPDDVDRFARRSGLTPRDAVLAGLFGHAALVPHLLETLAASNRVRRATGPWVHPLEVATARALERITGARLRDEAREVVDHDFERQPTIFVETWSAFWSEHGAELPAGAKLRWGRPFSPELTLRELAEPGTAESREDLALELAIALGDDGLEPGDWVARQRDQLIAVEERIHAGSYEAGAFLETLLRGG